MENSPQVVFERLFGDGSNAALRLSRKQQDKSILDAVTDKVTRLQTGLDAGDRADSVSISRTSARSNAASRRQRSSQPATPTSPKRPSASRKHSRITSS